MRLGILQIEVRYLFSQQWVGGEGLPGLIISAVVMLTMPNTFLGLWAKWATLENTGKIIKQAFPSQCLPWEGI